MMTYDVLTYLMYPSISNHESNFAFPGLLHLGLESGLAFRVRSRV